MMNRLITTAVAALATCTSIATQQIVIAGVTVEDATPTGTRLRDLPVELAFVRTGGPTILLDNSSKHGVYSFLVSQSDVSELWVRVSQKSGYIANPQRILFNRRNRGVQHAKVDDLKATKLSDTLSLTGEEASRACTAVINNAQLDVHIGQTKATPARITVNERLKMILSRVSGKQWQPADLGGYWKKIESGRNTAFDGTMLIDRSTFLSLPQSDSFSGYHQQHLKTRQEERGRLGERLRHDLPLDRDAFRLLLDLKPNEIDASWLRKRPSPTRPNLLDDAVSRQVLLLEAVRTRKDITGTDRLFLDRKFGEALRGVPLDRRSSLDAARKSLGGHR